jgi:prophage regulatory protein
MNNLLRRPEVLNRVGLSRSSMYNYIALGSFPRPIKIGRRAVAWHADSIDRWIASRPLSTGGMI